MAYTYPVANNGSVYHVTLHHSFANQTFMSNFHWRLEGNTNTRNIETVYDAMHALLNGINGLYSKIRTMQEPDQTQVLANYQQIYPQRYAGKAYNLALPGSLPEAGSLNVTQISAVITRRSVEATRRGLSNLHLPMACQTQTIGNGVILPTIIGLLGEIGNIILNAKNFGDGITMVPVVYHRNFVPATSVIETFIVQPQVRIMRRRTVGLGI